MRTQTLETGELEESNNLLKAEYIRKHNNTICLNKLNDSILAFASLYLHICINTSLIAFIRLAFPSCFNKDWSNTMINIDTVRKFKTCMIMLTFEWKPPRTCQERRSPSKTPRRLESNPVQEVIKPRLQEGHECGLPRLPWAL